MRRAILIFIFLFFLPIGVFAFTPTQKFTDQTSDRESGLYYYNARYYNPSVGKFVQPDPLQQSLPEDYLADPQQLNSYSYARNNPLRFVDATGEKVSEYKAYQPKNGTFQKGEVMGEYRGIKIYSAGPEAGKITHPYQCTQLVQNFSKDQYGLSLSGMGPAYNYSDKNKLENRINKNNSNISGTISVNNNGGGVMPQENDIITWSGGSAGHVGIIAEVTFDNNTGTGYVYTIEQNMKTGQGLFSQILTRTYDENGHALYTIGNRLRSYRVQSWTRYQNQDLVSQEEYTTTPYTPAPSSNTNSNH